MRRKEGRVRPLIGFEAAAQRTCKELAKNALSAVAEKGLVT